MLNKISLNIRRKRDLDYLNTDFSKMIICLFYALKLISFKSNR